MQTHNPESLYVGLLTFSTSHRRSLCSASPLLADTPPSSPPSPCSRSLLFPSPLPFSFPKAAPFPSSSSFLFLFFRSSLARFSRSNPSAFLLARSSSSSLTTHGSLNISFRKAVFSAQAAASSFVVRIIAVETRCRVSISLSPIREGHVDLHSRSSSICFASLKDPTPPFTLTTVPISTPFRSTSRPVAVTPFVKPLRLVGISASDVVVFASRVVGVGAGSPQVISIVAPLLSSSRAIQRVG